jgi:hypothetical protein
MDPRMRSCASRWCARPAGRLTAIRQLAGSAVSPPAGSPPRRRHLAAPAQIKLRLLDPLRATTLRALDDIIGMDQLSRVIAALRANPLLDAVAAMGIVAGAVLLLRKPKIQRDAEQRLSALRRDKADEYAKLRRPS